MGKIMYIVVSKRFRGLMSREIKGLSIVLQIHPLSIHS